MRFARKHYKLLIVAAACTAIGAGASAIATAGAASSATATTATTAGSAKAHAARGVVSARAIARRAVHANAVVATKNGFETVTLDRGFVQSVSGQQLTIKEGTKKATYKTVTLTVPSGAKVRDNGHAGALSSLTAGQRIAVIQGPKATYVIAR